MIPKIIHYCWFGKKSKPKEVYNLIDNWRTQLPDYKIKEWNESNFNYKQWKFCREAYETKKFAFVADVCRFYALLQEGGIYLDTDIEVIKNFDPFLLNQSFIGEERKHTIGSGCIGAEKDTPWIRNFISMYDNKDFINWKGRLLDYPNTIYLTKYLQKCENPPRIYPMDFFCAKDYKTQELNITSNTVCIHHYAATWFNKPTIINRIKNLIAKLKANL